MEKCADLIGDMIYLFRQIIKADVDGSGALDRDGVGFSLMLGDAVVRVLGLEGKLSFCSALMAPAVSRARFLRVMFQKPNERL